MLKVAISIEMHCVLLGPPYCVSKSPHSSMRSQSVKLSNPMKKGGDVTKVIIPVEVGEEGILAYVNGIG